MVFPCKKNFVGKPCFHYREDLQCIVQQGNERKRDVIGFRLTERNQVTAINLAYLSTKEIGAYV